MRTFCVHVTYIQMKNEGLKRFGGNSSLLMGHLVDDF